MKRLFEKVLVGQGTSWSVGPIWRTLQKETGSGRAVRNKNRSRLPAPSQARLPFASSLLAVFPHYPSHVQPHKEGRTLRLPDPSFIKPSAASDSIAGDPHSDWMTIPINFHKNCAKSS